MSGVRSVLEGSLDELEDLHARGVFTKTELREVVKRRTEMEYALARRKPNIGDYERAIEYEKRLERCRALRLRRARKATGKAGKKARGSGPSDVSIRARTHQLYERALRRFKGDLSLWLRYLEHCRREGATKRLSKAAARCLRLHVTAPEAWVYVADLEVNVHGNVEGARSLLQRAIKLNPQSEALWHELFRLELKFARQLAERRGALGIGDDANDADGDAEDDENGDKDDGEDQSEEELNTVENGHRFANGNGVGGDDDTDDTEADEEDEEDEPRTRRKKDKERKAQTNTKNGNTDAMTTLLSGGAAKIVFDRAVDQMKPTTVSFFAGFLKVLSEFRPDFLEVGERVCTALKSVHAKDANAWESVAKYVFEIAGTDAALDVLRDGVSTCATETMYSACIGAMRNHTESLFAAGERGEAKRLVLEMVRLCEKALTDGVMGEVLVQDYVRVLLQLGRRREALEAARDATRRAPQNCSAWLLRLRLHARLRSTETQAEGGDEHVAHVKLIEEAIDCVPLTSSAPVWMYAVRWCEATAAPQPTEWLTSRLEWALCVGGDASTSLQTVACAVVDMLRERHGLKRARMLVDKLIGLPRPGLAFMVHCIELEMEVLGATTAPPPSTERLTALVEAALVVYGHEEHDLWLRRWRIEKDANGNTGSIYWRAVKSLTDPAPFIAAIHKS